MENSKNFNDLAPHSVRGEVWRPCYDELSGAAPPARPAAVRELAELIDRMEDVGTDPAGHFGSRLPLEKAADLCQVIASVFKPENLHT
jgi:hypothetical protein